MGLTYVAFANESLTCYYRENFNILCKTCGITRDFKSILKLDFSNLINPISINFFVAIFFIFISRLISLFMLFKNERLRKILTFDILITFGIITIANTI